MQMMEDEFNSKVDKIKSEKKKLEEKLNMEQKEGTLLTMKLNILTNKTQALSDQKSYLINCIDQNIHSLKAEQSKLQEQTLRESVINGEQAVSQLQELLQLTMNSFQNVKEVINFMSFEELNLSFKTDTQVQDNEINYADLLEGTKPRHRTSSMHI